MYFSYGIPQAFRNFGRNWRASVSNVLIVAASLSVVGMIGLLYLNVVRISEIWLSDTKVSLFLRLGLEAAQRESVLERVRRHPMVKAAAAVSPEEGLRSLSEKLNVDGGFLTGPEMDGLPHTIDIEIYLDYRERIRGIAERFRKLPEVEDVVYADRALEKVRLFFSLTKVIGLSFIALFLLSFCLVIGYATRLSLYARRREIEILHLVGATRNFIRSAFVVEGMLIAFSGALIALAITWVSYKILVAGLTWNALTLTLKALTIFLPWPLLGLAIVLIIALGAVSSHLSVNRLLRELEP